MSGHSKWSTIKHKKGAADAKRGRLFTKLIKEITMAARVGGEASSRTAAPLGRPGREEGLDAGGHLREGIKRGTGELEGVTYEKWSTKATAPAARALLIEAMTDNKNRTTSEIRHLLTKYGGNMGSAGSVAFQFHKKGYISIEKTAAKEDTLMELAPRGRRRGLPDRGRGRLRDHHRPGLVRGDPVEDRGEGDRDPDGRDPVGAAEHDRGGGQGARAPQAPRDDRGPRRRAEGLVERRHRGQVPDRVRVLGVDPGSRATGWALVTFSPAPALEAAGVLRPPAGGLRNAAALPPRRSRRRDPGAASRCGVGRAGLRRREPERA